MSHPVHAIIEPHSNNSPRQIPIKDPKDESFTKINPNGRLPAIEDPNTGLTLWESGAIIEYLIETYDKEHKLTFTSAPEKWHLKQYLHFQMSGQVRLQNCGYKHTKNLRLTLCTGPLLWPGCLVPHVPS